MSNQGTIGILHIVKVRMISKDNEKIKHTLLMVGTEAKDIERKLGWIFDRSDYKEMSVKSVEKVREKVHFLSTFVTSEEEPSAPNMKQGESEKRAPSMQTETEVESKLFAVGLATTVFGRDETHAIRKLGSKLSAIGSAGSEFSGMKMPEGSTLQIEEIPKANPYAKPRDVSAEFNRATFVRG